MSVEEYLVTSFDPDCDYLDGEVVERNVGELPHGDAQGELIHLLKLLVPKLSIRVVPEIRIQIHSRRFRVADIAVWHAGNIGDRIPTVPPFLAVEVLSAEDRMVRIHARIQDYLSIGVEWIWVIDPMERKALIYSRQNPAGVVTDVLTTDNPRIEIRITAVFHAEDAQ